MRHLTAVDLFCGAGGSTTGAEMAGVNVILAVNHWRVAIYSHQANHPHTRHICARIDDIDPRLAIPTLAAGPIRAQVPGYRHRPRKRACGI